MEVLVRRLNQLEQQNRRWQWTATAALAVIGAGVVLAQPTPRRTAKVLEAEMFILRDAHGRSRAGLGLVDGASFLVLNDEDGKPGVALSVTPDGPRRLSLLDEEGTARSVLVARADGESGLRLFDKNRMHRASLDVMADGKPILRLADTDKKSPPDRFVPRGQITALPFVHTAASVPSK
jgi:hypothetical protein